MSNWHYQIVLKWQYTHVTYSVILNKSLLKDKERIMELQQTEVKNGKEGLHINVVQMCVTAVLMALTCVATMVVQIPYHLDMHILVTVLFNQCLFFRTGCRSISWGNRFSYGGYFDRLCNMGVTYTFN